MPCPDAFTLTLCADDELDAVQHREVTAHLATCRACADTLAALKSETLLLRKVLQHEAICNDTVGATGPSPSSAAAHRHARRGLLAASVALTLGAGVVRTGFDVAVAVTGVVLPAWLNPLQAEGRVNAAANAAWYLVDKGESVIASALFAGVASLSVLACLGAWAGLSRARIRAPFVLATMLLCVGVAAPASALEVRRGEANRDVTVAAGETVDDTLIAMGDEIRVEGTVTGNLVAMGRRVRVNGTVRGNVIAFARDVEIQGTVEGSLFLFGQTLTTRGMVGGDVTGFAQTITTPTGSQVSGNVTTFSETAAIDGQVGRDVTSFGQRLDITGMVGQKVTFFGEEVDIRSGARVGSTLTARVPNRENVRVAAGATVVGATDIRVRVDEPRTSRYLTIRFYVFQAIRFAAAFLAGWLFFWLVPSMMRTPTGSGGALFVTALMGAIAVVATPILAVLLGITLVGLPLAILGLMSWIVVLYLAKIVVALHVGRRFFGGPADGERLLATLGVGLLIVLAVVNLPYVGVVMNLLLTLTGVGLIVDAIWRWHRVAAGGRESAAG